MHARRHCSRSPAGRRHPCSAVYHRAESILEARQQWRPYREILTDGLSMAARRSGIAVTPEQAGAFVAAWPHMQVFPDVAEALGTLGVIRLAAGNPHQLRR